MSEEKEDPAWLEELFPGQAKAAATMKENGLVFASKYLVFAGPTADPRAREIFEHWTIAVRKARVPKTASLQELAAHNALREWVEGIWTQIEFAQKAQNVPQPRTK